MTSIFNFGRDNWKARATERNELGVGRPEPMIEEIDEAGLNVWELGKAIRRVAALTDGDLVNEARELCLHADAMARLMERVVLLFRDSR